MIHRPGALKSLVTPAKIATILSLSDDGSTSVISNNPAKIIDLRSTSETANTVPIDGTLLHYGITAYHEGLFRIIAKSTNGQGATPTSPGASKNYTLYYAFLHEATLSLSSALTVLQNIDASLVCDLPDDATSGVAGTRYHATDPFVIGGRYLYTWYTRSAFANANSKVDLQVDLIRL